MPTTIENETPEGQQQAQPEAPLPLPVLKTQAVGRVLDALNKPLMAERLLRMAGGDASRATKHLTAFTSLIMNDEGQGRTGAKKYLCQCTTSSLVLAFMEAEQMQLTFDSRALVSLIIRDWQADLEISYKGFVNALSKHYANAFVDAELVYEGDVFTTSRSNGNATYSHVQADPFAHGNFDKVVGAYCYFSYTQDNGTQVARIKHMRKDEIETVRSKAKTDAVWKEFFGEQVLKSVIRRAAKIPFAAIDLDVDLEAIDNRHYDLEKPASVGGNQNLALLIQQQRQVVGLDAPVEKTKETPQPTEATPAAVVEDAPADDTPPATEPGEMQEGPRAISDADFDDAPAPVVDAAAVVRTEGKTQVIMDGKPIRMTFETPRLALGYMRGVMSKRQRADRQQLLDENQHILDAVTAEGYANLVADLCALVNA